MRGKLFTVVLSVFFKNCELWECITDSKNIKNKTKQNIAWCRKPVAYVTKSKLLSLVNKTLL